MHGFGNDSESKHGDRDSETNGNGISEDVAHELVFDAGGIVFQGKDKPRESNTGEVKERHFDGAKWVAQRQNGEKDGEDTGVDGLGKKE